MIKLKKTTKKYKQVKPSNTEDDINEFGLAAELTFNRSRDFLLNPNLWIADSAALNHITPHNVGMKNAQNMTTQATWGNGTTNKAMMSGDIQGVLTIKAEFQQT